MHKATQLFSAPKPPTGDKVRVRLHEKRVTRDDNGEVVHTKPEHSAIDVDTREWKCGGEIVTLYRSQTEGQDLGTLVEEDSPAEVKKKIAADKL